MSARFTGYAALFDRVDRAGDVMRAGAFGAPRTVPLLWQHRGNPVGRASVREDASGLCVDGIIDDPGLSAAVRSGAVAGLRVLDAPPGRIGGPYAVVDEPVLTDWSTKTWTGREGRLSVALYDGGERPARLRGLSDAVEDALADPPALGAGWRIVRLTFARSRIARIATDRWTAVVEFQVRMLREDS